MNYKSLSIILDAKMSKAFHGTGADFDEFSLDYTHSGEGSNVYGRGVYLTGCYDTASYYARTTSHTYGDHDNISYKGDVRSLGSYKAPLELVLWDLADIMYAEGVSAEEGVELLKADTVGKSERYEYALFNLLDPSKVTKGVKYVYSVEIPALSENKYWYYNAPLTDESRQELYEGLVSTLVESLKRRGKADDARIARAREDSEVLLDSSVKTSNDVIRALYEMGLDAEDYFTRILQSQGYIGVIVPIGFKNGAPKGVRGNNFVIFDPKNVHIKKKENV